MLQGQDGQSSKALRMAGYRRTKSGFIESTGLGYALEKIGDPGRGRKDAFSITLAISSLEEIEVEIARVSRWAAEEGVQIEHLAAGAREAVAECRTILGAFRTQGPAKKAADAVSLAYKSLWARIENH